MWVDKEQEISRSCVAQCEEYTVDANFLANVYRMWGNSLENVG